MSDARYTFYSYWRSSAAYRVRIALGMKGLRYETVGINLAAGVRDQHSPGFRALNPQGLVPALAVGDEVLGESLAIIEYLDETHPEPPFLPAEPLARARIRWMAQAVACDIHPLNNLRVLNYLREPLGQDEAAVTRWVAHWIGEGFAALEALATRYSVAGTCLYGDTVSLADICLVPQIYNARRFAVPLDAYPTLKQIGAALEALPAFAAARPEAQPEAAR